MATTSRTLITADEYRDRIASLRAVLADRGFHAALVWGRGGGTADRGADVRYLTGFYPVFPTIRDVSGLWSDRGLSALLVSSDEVLLFSDDSDASESTSGVTGFISRSGVSDRTLVGDVIAALRDRPQLTDVAILSGDAMSGQQARRLLADAHAAQLSLTWDEELIEELRLRKSPDEVALMRQAARVAEAALEAGFAATAPGVAESEVVAAMVHEVAAHEAAFANAFVYTTPLDGTAADNRQPTHGSRALEAGDLFTIDITGTYGGYFFDLARSWVVGGSPTAAQNRAYDVARRSVDEIVSDMRPGVRLGEASARGSAVLRDAGIDPDSGEFPARGHGLGLAFEAPWVRDDSDLVLEPGMVISIEQFVSLDGASATFERNILIGSSGPEDLVAVRDFWAASTELEAH
ncbi:Xaa-Pro peptidase family protein [Leucobacter rhizosphaerae]|uniref:Xaa-Pro peptidase family protein n=1 Tax=Leucobacter rhizosphaerae TaxID=2932245 RepID=A0ABY4FZS3_9MICO|nr:Xaa-Pro peptidase family protein [Leucobacter rhizosphaerae]UOQ61817.1 Xaa-Pro peptidase family protein [Leucobacter rhizosphaerae]